MQACGNCKNIMLPQNDDVDLESSDGQKLVDNEEKVEEKEGEKMPEKAHYSDAEDVELTNKQCKA